MPTELKGIFFATVTPFTSDYRLDEQKLREEIGYLLDKKVNGLLVNGSTGESLSLSMEERQRVVEIVTEECRHRVPVISGIEDSATSKVVEEAKLVRKAGADAALVVTPPYLNPTWEGIFKHYEKVNETGVPIVIYNNPDRTYFNLTAQMVEKLTTLNKVIGMKQSKSDLSKTAEIVRLVDNKISIINSYGDTAFYPGLLVGGKAALTQIFFFIPEKIHELYDEIKRYNIERARKIWLDLLPLWNSTKGVHGEPNPVPLKEAMKIVGRSMGPPRLPLTPATEDTSKRIEKIFREYKVIH